MTPRDDAAASVVGLIARARHVAVLSGAGMSAASGIPTFRAATAETPALWNRYDPMTLATAEAFQDDPGLVWGWYLWRIGMVRRAQPNPGHLAIARLEEQRRVSVVTQNVDELHERAGSSRVYHLHGRLEALRCFDCGLAFRGTAQASDEPIQRVLPPTCSRCGGYIRPGVVWFGEVLPPEEFAAGYRAVQEAEVVLVVGTSGVVYPAAGLPAVARGAGVPVVEVNPEETPISDMCDVVIRRSAAEALPELLQAAHPAGDPMTGGPA